MLESLTSTEPNGTEAEQCPDGGVPATIGRYESLRRVIIFRADLLPRSETFILAQAGALKRFEPVFVGLRRVSSSLQLPATAIVAAGGDSLLQRCDRGIYKAIGVRPRFHKAVQHYEPQLIHAHFAIDGVLAMPLARRLRLPLIVTLHGYDVTVSETECARSWTGRLYLKRRKKLWEQAAVFLCVSDFIRNKALAAGFPEGKLRRHHIGIDQKLFQRTAEPPDRSSVLFVGRLVEKKGCDRLIRAMAIVQRQLPGVPLTIVGDGPMRESLERLAQTLDVNCKFIGVCPPEQIKQILQTATLFCAPSRTAKTGDSEGLGMVFLEAQAMGVPVVSSFHGGIPEAVIHGETGLLAPEGDYLTLAEHLQLLLRRAELRLRFGVRGAEWVKQTFDLETQTAQLEDIYDEILGKIPQRVAPADTRIRP